ncbi:hypothetical protein COCMIDRAFT_83498 [Bipolaris oryzae ATCC 44560]|uniref:Uncharacterized protein n=1 Tax=Bipolaris oryzae ATCC 44560 TaxID=930090 RepID=W6ZDE5_COCMI|nr:uncharacterized protein COCMIDRAFT_83498 [Bipolaris oryzae ATCC 44560]EUC49842.1 hypothetical protein COCMIDRAFT_83498 [Bipolaris oryzae ATCC 44560]
MTQAKKTRERLSRSRKKERKRKGYRTTESDFFFIRPPPNLSALYTTSNQSQKGPLKPATRSRPNLKRRWKRVQEICRYGASHQKTHPVCRPWHATCQYQYPKQRVHLLRDSGLEQHFVASFPLFRERRLYSHSCTEKNKDMNLQKEE